MATVGIAAAARLAGVNASTVHRAMRAGRLSYTTDPAGKRRIDVAELGRVFELKSAEAVDFPGANGTIAGNGARTVQRKTAHSGENDALHRLLDERERTIAQYLETIRDLRHRLDLEAAERRQLSERLAGLLTARAAPGTAAVPGSAGEPAAANFAQCEVSSPAPSARAGLVIPPAPWWRRWVKDQRGAIAGMAVPRLAGINDRANDSWLPLRAIARAAGEAWAVRADAAALSVSADREETEDNPNVLLLRDIRTVLAGHADDWVSGALLAGWLVGMPDRPWGEWGRPPRLLTQNALARLLRPFEIYPGSNGIGRGYQRKHFDSAFDRYL